MIKLRVQGTKHNIHQFYKTIAKCPDHSGSVVLYAKWTEIKIMQVSEIYSNKGTNRYFRWYADIQIIESKENENE